MKKKNENILKFIDELSDLTDEKFNFWIAKNHDNTEYEYLNIQLEDNKIRTEFWINFIQRWFGKDIVIEIGIEENKLVIEVNLLR